MFCLYANGFISGMKHVYKFSLISGEWWLGKLKLDRNKLKLKCQYDRFRSYLHDKKIYFKFQLDLTPSKSSENSNEEYSSIVLCLVYKSTVPLCNV